VHQFIFFSCEEVAPAKAGAGVNWRALLRLRVVLLAMNAAALVVLGALHAPLLVRGDVAVGAGAPGASAA
jgi:hypothetical protein